MRVFITGGSGFIGKNLIEQLAPRHEVLAPPRRELELLDAEAVRAWLRRERPDAIIHSATTPGHRNAPAVADLALRNLRMFTALAECEGSFGKLIVLGSGAEYDQRHYRPKLREDQLGEHLPVDDTGFSKFAIARAVEKHPGWVHLRPFGVFGQYEDWQIRFISNALCKALFDLPITLRQNRRFDYVHVGDLIGVIEHFLEHPARYPAYNVTPDQSIELKTLAELVLEVTNKKLPILIAQPGMGLEYSGDNSRLRAELPELRFTPLREAIAGLFRWYQANQSLLRREALLTDK